MEQELPDSRSWLKKVSFHAWAFWEMRKALIALALNSAKTTTGQQCDEQLDALVRRLIAIGDAVEDRHLTSRKSRFRTGGALLRYQHYGFITLSIISVPEEWRNRLNQHDLKRLVHFAALALQLYKDEGKNFSGPVKAGRESDQRRMRNAMRSASIHGFLADCYFKLNAGDLAQDLDMAFNHLRTAIEILAQISSQKASWMSATMLARLGDTLLKYPAETNTAYAQEAVDALVKAKELAVPLIGAIEPLAPPDVVAMRTQEWRKLPSSVRLKYALRGGVANASHNWNMRSGKFGGWVPAGGYQAVTLAKINWSLGSAYRRVGDLNRAIEHLEIALADFPDVDSRASIRVEIGSAHLELSNGPNQDEQITKAYECFKNIKAEKHLKFVKPWALAVMGEARCYLVKLGRSPLAVITKYKRSLDQSATQLRTVMRVTREESMFQVCQEASFLLGRVHALCREYDRAYQALVLASRLTDRIRRRSRTPRLKNYWAGTGVSLYDNLIFVASRYPESGAGDGELALTRFSKKRVALRSAITFSERARVVFLQEELANQELLPKGATHDSVREFFALRRAWHKAELSLQEWEALSCAQLSEIRLRRDTLEAQYFQTLEAVRKQFDDDSYDPDRPVLPASFSRIQSAVEFLSQERNTALIEYHIRYQRVCIFVVVPRTEQYPCTLMYSSTGMSGEVLNEISSHWVDGYDLLRSRNLAKNWEAGYLQHVLGMLQPLAEIPSERISGWEKTTGRSVERIIVVPHRFLHLIPLHAIELASGGTWGDQRTIQYVPSSSVLCRLVEQQDRKSSPGRQNCAPMRKVVAIASPWVDKDNVLAFSHQEAQSTVDLMGGELLEGVTACRDRIIETIRDADHIHFACHGSHDQEHPMDSGLILPTGDSKVEPGSTRDERGSTRLTLADIFERVRLPRGPVVVLSACETGLTRVGASHDEYVGLPAGFFYAGARTVVSSLWPVSDLATYLLMRAMTREYAAGVSVPTALRGAQLWLQTLSAESVLQEINEIMEKEKDADRLKIMGHSKLAIEQMRILEPFPFASRYWWAGFIVSGLG